MKLVDLGSVRQLRRGKSGDSHTMGWVEGVRVEATGGIFINGAIFLYKD